MSAKAKTLSMGSKGQNILSMIKGTFWAVSCSLLCVLILAFIVKFTGLSESAIMPINQVIKVLSILVGAYVMSKKTSSNGWFWGLLLGFFYTLLAFLVFSILDGEFRFTLALLNDIAFGTVLGLISGIITFALRR